MDINNRTILEALIKCSTPSFKQMDNAMVKKAGFRYYDQNGKTEWNSLDALTDKELYELYKQLNK